MLITSLSSSLLTFISEKSPSLSFLCGFGDNAEDTPMSITSFDPLESESARSDRDMLDLRLASDSSVVTLGRRVLSDCALVCLLI